MTAKAANVTTNGIKDDHAGHDHSAEGPDAHGGDAAMAHGGHGGMKGMNMTKALPVPDSCVKNPKQANCSSFDYPHANSANDLTRLCNAMSFMTGAGSSRGTSRCRRAKERCCCSCLHGYDNKQQGTYTVLTLLASREEVC